MAKREKFSWRKVVLEAFMIVLSVLLALFINEWKSNKNEERNTKLMMEHISAELVNNQKLVEELIPYHVSVLKKIQTAAFQDSLTYLFLRNGYFELSAIAPKGVIQGEFQNIAWSTSIEYIIHVTAKCKPTAQEHGVLLSTLAVLVYCGGSGVTVSIVGGCFDFVAFQVES